MLLSVLIIDTKEEPSIAKQLRPFQKPPNEQPPNNLWKVPRSMKHTEHLSVFYVGYPRPFTYQVFDDAESAGSTSAHQWSSLIAAGRIKLGACFEEQVDCGNLSLLTD